MSHGYESLAEWIETEVQPLLLGEAMTCELDDLEVDQLVEIWVLIDQCLKALDERKKAVRERLLKEAEEHGTLNDRGGQKLRVGGAAEGTTVVREKRVASEPDEKGLRSLLEETGIKFAEAYSKVTKTVVDQSKVQNLVNLGKLKENDIDALKKVTWALRVYPAEELVDLLDELTYPGPSTEELKEGNAPRSKRKKSKGERKKG